MQDVTTFPIDEACLREDQTFVSRKPWFYLPLRQWVVTVLWAVLIFLVTQTWIIQGYQVYGCCMEPNFCTGERLLGSKLALMTGVHRGDVVVFRPPHKPQTAFIKRVVGLPGDLVYINHRPLTEPYLQRTWQDNRPPERIAADRVFVLGDNRDNSNDSRAWGELPIANIQAKAWLRYWPINRLALVQ
jgi:signal peptidase I